jgi:hypothetical protein
LGKLTRNEQQAPIKVVFPGSGGGIKAAVITAPALIDTTLYYCECKSIDEANYLAAFLNASIISADLKLRGATGHGGGLRHIHKLPLDYNIPQYDATDAVHQGLVFIAQEMTAIAQQTASTFASRTVRQTQIQIQCRLSEKMEILNQMVERALGITPNPE